MKFYISYGCCLYDMSIGRAESEKLAKGIELNQIEDKTS